MEWALQTGTDRWWTNQPKPLLLAVFGVSSDFILHD
jgi:hypothetical protein